MKIQKKYIFPVILIFIFVIIFSSNHLSADYSAYLSSYNHIEQSSMEILYKYSVRIGNFIGLSYNQFLIFYSFFGFILIYSTILKYSKYANWVLIAYFCCPFFDNVVQIRDFFASAIMLFSIRYLIGEDRNYIKYGIAILIAAGFHKLSLVYLIFLLTFIDIKNIKKIVFIGVPIQLILFSQTNIITTLILSLGDKYSTYFDNGQLNSMPFFNALLFSIFILGTISIMIFCNFYKDKMKYDEYDEWMIKIGYLSTFFIFAIVMLGNNFYRIFRDIIPLYYIAYSNISFCRNENNTFFLGMFKLGICVYPLILFVFLNDFEKCVIPIFQSLLK